MPASLLGLLILLIRSWKLRTAYFYCILAALVLFIVALLITVIIEVPIDNQIKTWSATTIPSNWENIRDRWEYFHTIRTWTALGGITFFMAAIMKKDTDTAQQKRKYSYKR